MHLRSKAFGSRKTEARDRPVQEPYEAEVGPVRAFHGDGLQAPTS